jgi:deoxyribose-phosphate aldolase
MSNPITTSSTERIVELHRDALERILGGSPRATPPGRPPAPPSIAGRIEHTLLSTAASDEDVRRVCREAEQYAFRAVCCLPRDVAACRRRLEGTSSLVVTVVDFPLAQGGAAAAEAECRRAVDAGADEIDMVVDIRALRAGDLGAAAAGVERVVAAAGGRPVKVILETALLAEGQIASGAAVAEAGGASFVKTSTGYSTRGASAEDVRLLRAAVGDRLGIKASGGIRDRAAAEEMIAAGADLIGTSNGPRCAS